MTDNLVKRLREHASGGGRYVQLGLFAEAADRIEALEAELATEQRLSFRKQMHDLADRIEALEAERERLRTVMVAAAEEIDRHWQAHCDAEGYGPANLMRRLEEGIAVEYGYTAGEFRRLQEKAKADTALLRQALEAMEADAAWGGPTPKGAAAIAALRERLE